jgi:Concanavalin A-like lectin/glucanases superfamily
MAFAIGPILAQPTSLILSLDSGNPRCYNGTASTMTDLSLAVSTINRLNLEPVVTLVSSPVYSSSLGGYLTFNGSSNYVTATNLTPSAVVSINAWIYMADWTVATVGTFVSNADADGTVRYQIGLNNASYASSLGAIIKYATGTLVVSYAKSSLTAGWHLVSVTFDGVNARLYVDSVLVSTSSTLSATTSIDYTSINTLGLGAKVSNTTITEYIGCSIGPVSVHASTLSAAEITTYFGGLRSRYSI